MIKKNIEESLVNHAGGALVTISDVARWSGRSKEYLKQNILKDLEYINNGTSKFYYAGDVAKAMSEQARY